MNDTKIMNRLQEHRVEALKTYKCDWFVLCAQGSMNYGIMDNESDVDTKMLTLPSLHELVLNSKSMNKVYEMSDNAEHVDMKDVREYFKIFRKSNINFVEILFTDYWLANPRYQDLWLALISRREELARINPYAAISCMKGMASEKVHALCHEYPSRMYYIDKYGYDGKQLSHLARIDYFIHEYVKGSLYKDCIYPKNKEFRDYLLGLKRHTLDINKEEAMELANKIFEDISTIANTHREYLKNKNDPELDEFLNDILYKLMERALKEELK